MRSDSVRPSICLHACLLACLPGLSVWDPMGWEVGKPDARTAAEGRGNERASERGRRAEEGREEEAVVSKKASERVPFCPPSIVGIRIERDRGITSARPATSRQRMEWTHHARLPASLGAGVMQGNIRSLTS